MEIIFSLLGNLDVKITMVIVWSIIIAIALLIEFLTYSFYSAWFAAGGVAALISAPCGLDWPWQILVFFVVSLGFLLGLRPFVAKFVRTKTTPTNLDANVGLKVKLLKDVRDGRSEIKLNDIIWTVACDAELKEGASVEITGMSGNKYLVKDIVKEVSK